MIQNPRRKPGFWQWELSLELRVEVCGWGSQEDLSQFTTSKGLTYSPTPQPVHEGRGHLLCLQPIPQLSSVGNAKLLVIKSRIRERLYQAPKLLSSGFGRHIFFIGTQLVKTAPADGCSPKSS